LLSQFSCPVHKCLTCGAALTFDLHNNVKRNSLINGRNEPRKKGTQSSGRKFSFSTLYLT
jgi:hypothetical protein